MGNSFWLTGISYPGHPSGQSEVEQKFLLPKCPRVGRILLANIGEYSEAGYKEGPYSSKLISKDTS